MYSGFNLKINATRDCGPDSINFLDPSYICDNRNYFSAHEGE